MSKICPNCQEVFDDNHAFCSSCGSCLVEMEKPAPTLNLGDANAISGGVNINQSKNITSHDVHYHAVQERNKSEKELLQDRQNQYHDTVAKLLKGGVITVEARAQLDKLKFNLGLDDSIAANIESTVKNEQKTQARAGNDGLSVIGKMALKSAVAAVEENSPQVQSCIVKLAPVCKTTMNEQVHFYYSMLLAASDPQRCVEAYEKRTIDSYWLSYWASVAYRKLGNEMEAEGILTEMTGLWQERPEINVVINACLGIWLSCSGNLAECQETIVEYLTQTEEVPSEELNDLFHSLLYAVGVEENDSSRYSFYNEHFLMSFDENTELKKAKRAYDKEDYETAFSIWKQLAKRNNAEAICKIGVCYDYGHGVLEDTAEAVKWYRKAADLGLPDAMNFLGECYFYGSGVTQDSAKMIEWYLKAADLGQTDAMNNLGDCYRYGQRVTQDHAEAVKWYHKAADLGHVEAMYNLGSIAEDIVEEFKWYKKAAELGYTEAMADLADLLYAIDELSEAAEWGKKALDKGYEDDFGKIERIIKSATNSDLIQKNEAKKTTSQTEGITLSLYHYYCAQVLEEEDKVNSEEFLDASKWLAKAVKGDAIAQNNLGCCYYIDDKYDEAELLLTKSAEQGVVEAQLGLLVYCVDNMVNGGIEDVEKKAIEWGTKLAEQGLVSAQFLLGLYYMDEEGASAEEKAAKWFNKAAEQGLAFAQFILGECYMNGEGVNADKEKAVKWFTKAAEQGLAFAQFELGECYMNGEGGNADKEKAVKWYIKAAEQGDEYSKQALDDLGLTPDEQYTNFFSFDDIKKT